MQCNKMLQIKKRMNERAFQLALNFQLEFNAKKKENHRNEKENLTLRNFIKVKIFSSSLPVCFHPSTHKDIKIKKVIIDIFRKMHN